MEKADIQRLLTKVLRTSKDGSYVRRVSLFGSQLHGTATADSDVDLLIEFSEPISMFALVHMERDFSAAIGRKVDLSTPNSLSKYFRSDVLKEAEPLFEFAA